MDSFWSIPAIWWILTVHLVWHIGCITHSNRRNVWGQLFGQTISILTDVHLVVRTIRHTEHLDTIVDI